MRKSTAAAEQPIIPTEGESVFESYLSILSDIIGTNNIYSKIIENYNEANNTKIELQQTNNDSALPNRKGRGNNLDPIIYNYKPRSDDSTHYRVYKYNPFARRKWEIVDPYDLYQKKSSQGFCQMFAFFIATNNTQEFLEKIDDNDKDLLTLNTFLCLRKVIDLINSSSSELKNRMKAEFENIKYEESKGIVDKSLTFDDFVSELNKFNISDIRQYIDDLY